MDLIIEGNAFIKNQIQDCCIGIKNGKIVEIKKTLDGAPRKKYTNKIILPSGIDIHVHFRDPGNTHKEDFYHGSTAAAYGGISCVCDMPNNHPFTSTNTALIEKDRIAKNKAVVDYGLYLGIDENNLSTLEAGHELCCGYKLFMGKSTDATSLSTNKLPQLFHQLQKEDKILAVHAEDEQCLNKHSRNEKSLDDHLLSRPEQCEIKAIERLLELHKETNIRMHICHITTAKAIKKLLKRNQDISIGVTPHHMFFNSKIGSSNSSFFKVNPPLRTNNDNKFIWKSFLDGMIDVIESDHAPHTFDEKSDVFDSSPSGMPGVETMFPILLAKSKKEDIPLSVVVNAICYRSGRLMRIPKGEIKVGFDADFCVVDYDNIQKISSENIHYKCGWTAFEGFDAIFPSDVLVRGNPIIEDYELVGDSGLGRNIAKRGA
jgi:dihydroorotase